MRTPKEDKRGIISLFDYYGTVIIAAPILSVMYKRQVIVPFIVGLRRVQNYYFLILYALSNNMFIARKRHQTHQETDCQAIEPKIWRYGNYPPYVTAN